MKPKKELIVHRDPKSPVSEVFRTLRTNIQFMSTNKKLKTLLITSTFPSEGKSWVSSNLAVTFAQAGNKVILIDADMRKGRQYTIFGASPRPGLSNYLSGVDEKNPEEIDVSKYIQKTEVENLLIMTAGNIPPNPSELLVSEQMVNLLDELKEICDIVIIDGTPCELVTDSIILSRIVDTTVIVTAHKETKKDNLEKIIRNVQNVGGNLAGVVVNKMPVSVKKYNENYYYASTSGTPKNNMEEQNKVNSTQPKINKNNDVVEKEPVEKEKKNKTSSKSTGKTAGKTTTKKTSTKNKTETKKTTTKKETEAKKSNTKTETKKTTKKSKNMDERTQDILNQINLYLEKEKDDTN